MIKYTQSLSKTREAFLELVIQHIPRNENIRADQLAKMASTLSRTASSDITGHELISQIEFPEDNTEK